jgi:hypothetical protein
VHVHLVALELLDLGRGRLDELVGEISKRARHCKLLTDAGPIRILWCSPGASPSTELSIVDA